MHEQKPYVPKRFPTWILTPDGNKMIVQNCQQMSAMMGEEYDENAELVVKAPPAPPAVDPAPPVNAAPGHQDPVKELLAEMQKQSAAAHVDVLKEMDPMGIFATPEPEEQQPPVVAEKKRGVKAAKE